MHTQDYLRLPNFGYPQPFPVDALPLSIQLLITEAAQKYQAPPEMIFQSCLSGISLASQPLYKVKRYDGAVTQVAVWMLCIATSGIRKTSIDRHFMTIFDDLKKGIDEAALLNESVSDNEAEKLPKSIKRKFKYSDATPQAVAHGLSQWASGALISNEAGGLLNSRTTSNLSMFNMIWDGQPYEVDRVSCESLSLENVYLTLNLMVQRKIFQKFLIKNGQFSRDSGFSARVLQSLIDEDNYIGTRFEDPRNIGAPVNLPELDKYLSRIQELVKQSLTPDQLLINEPAILNFDWQAKRACLDFYNEIEFAMQKFQPLADIRDAGSKALDNMCRIAALFHIYDGAHGEITESSVQRAIEVICWYLNTFKYLYGQRAIQQNVIPDFLILENWIVKQLIKSPTQWALSKNTMRKNCSPLSKDKRFDHALNHLLFDQKVLMQKNGNADFVTFNPSYFQGLVNQQITQQPQQLLTLVASQPF